MRAFDMSRYQRIIATEGRVHGSWKVSAPGRRREVETFTLVPIDVTVFDEDMNSGRVFYSGDFTIMATPDQVKLVGPVNEGKRADLEDGWDAVVETVLAVVEAFRGSADSGTGGEP